MKVVVVRTSPDSSYPRVVFDTIASAKAWVDIEKAKIAKQKSAYAREVDFEIYAVRDEPDPLLNREQ